MTVGQPAVQTGVPDPRAGRFAQVRPRSVRCTMSDHKYKAPSPRQQAVEVLAVTLLDMLLRGTIPAESGQQTSSDEPSVAIRSHAQ